MRIRPLAAALVGALLAGTVASAPPARADHHWDYFPDPSFEVVAVKASPEEISVKEMGTVPVTITMTTRPAQGQEDKSGTVMALTEDERLPHPAELTVTLELVAQEGSTKHWRGVVNVGGPTRTVGFNGAYNCELACNDYPTPIAGPQIRVRASDTPLVTFTKTTPVKLTNRTYAVRGRVLKATKRSFGRPVTVVVSRGEDCWRGIPTGTAVRTTPDGRFKAVLKNTITMPGDGASMQQLHCAKILSNASDVRNRRAYIAYDTTNVPWKLTLPVRAPKTFKRGKKAAVHTSAGALGMTPLIVFERLEGRGEWSIISLGEIRPNGRATAYIRPLELGRHTYRLRSWESTAMSKTFTVTTVR